MISLKVVIEEYEPMLFNIVRERADSKSATEIETAIAGAIEAALQDRINEIMAKAKEAVAETSEEVANG